MRSCRICWHTTKKRANIIRHLKLIHDITDRDGNNAKNNSNKTVKTTSYGNDLDDCADTTSSNCSTFTNSNSRIMKTGIIDARRSMMGECQQGTNSRKRRRMMHLQNKRPYEEDDRQKPYMVPEEDGDRIGGGLKVKESTIRNTVRHCYLSNEFQYELLKDSDSVQDDFDDFYQVLLTLVDRFYPMKTVMISNMDPEYMTLAIKSQLKQKNKLMRQGHLEKANALSKRIGSAIAKKNSDQIKSKGDKITSKGMWNVVRKLSNRTNTTNRPVAGIDSRTLNEHYARISRDSNYVAPSKKSTVSTNEEIVSEYEVFKLLDKLKRTATGLDELPAWFLRIGASVSSKYIAKLFGKSILEGVVLTQWKQAYIKPIAKVTSPSVPADYRPISITPVLCRVMEKLVVRSFIYPALLTAPSPLSLWINVPSVKQDQQQQQSTLYFTKSRHY